MSLSNFLTFSRILLSPVFVFTFVYWDGLWARIISLVLVIIMELTDAFDGYFARRRNEVSDFGKLLDPLADSLSRLTIFFCFMLEGIAPIWMILIFLYRDSTVSTTRIVSAYNNVVMAARASGKIKAIVQATAIIAILVGRIVELLLPELLPFAQIYWWLMAGAAVVTIYSLYDYLHGNWQILRPFIR